MDKQEDHLINKISNRTCEDTSTTDVDSLSDMFDKGFELYNNLNKTEKPTNSPEIQTSIKHAMKLLEDATKLVSLVDMFSNNECFEEVATENIKYFLLPALLGTLTTKICETDNRLHIVDVAEIYFVDFLKRLKSYALIDIEIPELKNDENKKDSNAVSTKSNAELITDMVNTRNTKILRYKNQKELEKKLDVLSKNLDSPNIDEESKREYFITLLKIYANQVIDELSSLAAERPILEHMKKIGHDSSSTNSKNSKQKGPSKKLQPIIITRDALQKKVYGAGYPSLPVLTVEEFYDQKVKSGEWAKPEDSQQTSKTLQNLARNQSDDCLETDKEDEEKEEKIDKDDPDTLAQARAMDEYKDSHRRGWGNRFNRS